MRTDPAAARAIDLPPSVPLDEGADLSVLDEAKIITAPDGRGVRGARSPRP
jgi:hypothetical protein